MLLLKPALTEKVQFDHGRRRQQHSYYKYDRHSCKNALLDAFASEKAAFNDVSQLFLLLYTNSKKVTGRGMDMSIY